MSRNASLIPIAPLCVTFSSAPELENRIAAVTPEAILQALRRHIDPSKLSVIKAGDFEKKVSR
jgi:predicted Zn-dependent peptidase